MGSNGAWEPSATLHADFPVSSLEQSFERSQVDATVLLEIRTSGKETAGRHGCPTQRYVPL